MNTENDNIGNSKENPEEVPEILRGIGREAPFEVPDGYFDTLRTEVMSKIGQRSHGSSGGGKRGLLVLFRDRRWRAVAASLAILLFSGLTYALVTEVIIPVVQRTSQGAVEQQIQPESPDKDTHDPDALPIELDSEDESELQVDPAPYMTPSSADVSDDPSVRSPEPASQDASPASRRTRITPSSTGAGRLHTPPSTPQTQQPVSPVQPPAQPTTPSAVGQTFFGDTVVCHGEQLVYRAVEDPRYHTFVWYLNGTQMSRNTSREMRINTASLNRATHRVSLVVSDTRRRNVVNVVNAALVVADRPEIRGDRDVCSYGQVVLNAGPTHPWWEYQWSTGQRTAELPVERSGSYSLTIRLKGGNCHVTDTFHVQVMQKPTIEFNREQTVCAGESIRLRVNDPSGEHAIRWLPENRTGSVYTFSQRQPGRYPIKVEVRGCTTLTKEAIVSVNDCRLRIPNFFTPNNDGINDNFVILGLEHYPGSRLLVTDRNGRRVFESNDYHNEWDGNNLPDGTYIYIFYPGGDENMVRRGYVTIRR